jgi:hypothetical protein
MDKADLRERKLRVKSYFTAFDVRLLDIAVTPIFNTPFLLTTVVM